MLYVLSIVKGDLEVKRMELKSNQSCCNHGNYPCGIKVSNGGGE